MNSISDALALTPGPSWHEAVAIVQEIAANLQPGQPLPAPEDLLLEPDGTVSFGFAGESARPQVADLASLLSSLLQKSDAPQALRDLALENDRDEPAHSSIAGFTRALSFYERPNRRSDLQAVAGRLEGRARAAQAERTLSELRERVAQKSAETSERPNPVVPRSAIAARLRELAIRPRTIVLAAGVLVASLAVVALLAIQALARKAPAHGLEAASVSELSVPTEPPAGATDAVPAVDRAVSADSRVPDRRPVGTTATTHRAPKPAERTAPRQQHASRPPLYSSSKAPLHGGLARIGIAPVRPLPAARVPTALSADLRTAHSAESAPVAHATAVPAPVPDSAVYTSANGQVTPPVWARRQLPSEPSPDSQTGYFEIVIDTNGDVESVRLISPTRRYEERMLMAAAKAWKFRPAQLNGQPVRYQMRVPITLTWTIDQ